MNDTKLLEAYTRLVGFKNNIPENKHSIEESYVLQYHEILDLLEKISQIDLNGFRVPRSEIAPQLASHNVLSGQSTYTKTHFCKRPMLMMKVDAALSFFQFQIQGDKKETIGFRPAQ